MSDNTLQLTSKEWPIINFYKNITIIWKAIKTLLPSPNIYNILKTKQQIANRLNADMRS